jgi:uncharacterized protein YjbI with pentapeptide repeats
MKKYFFLVLAVIAIKSQAQQKIKASEIIALIDAGKTVSLKDAEIEGVLDLTNLKNQEEPRFSWLGDDAVKSTVTAPLRFVNCTFLDDVLAYYHVQREGTTYVADFRDDVVFQHCTFRHASEFKYSDFAGKADFSESVFDEPANFKYAKFSTNATFAKASFRDEANFKYAKFPEGSSLEGADFEGPADFKYTKFKSPLYVRNVAFHGSRDFKYSKVGGRSFSDFLWDER